MSTVGKALTLLDVFSDEQPSLGLSALARVADLDKATTQRMLKALETGGLVEQDATTRNWRLGAGILRLARIREATFPVSAVIQPVLERLAAETGETAHASLAAGATLATIGVVESTRSSRVFIEPGLKLPLHATASGLAFLAFSRPEIVARCLKASLPAITEHTETDPQALTRRLDTIRKDGHSVADQSLETDVYGIAAPVFGADGFACGAIAVATPAHRMSDPLRKQITWHVMQAGVETSAGLGGAVPAHYGALQRHAAE